MKHKENIKYGFISSIQRSKTFRNTIFFLTLGISPLLSKSLQSQLYKREDVTYEPVEYQNELYSAYELKIQGLLAVDFEKADYEKTFEIIKLLINTELGFDLLEFLFENKIHETDSPLVPEIYLLFAQECEKREIYESAARAYKILTTTFKLDYEEKYNECMNKAIEKFMN
ncbi:hypothetical protein KO317_03620 [Candidatus Micrarchaeota archaeon]|jgi:hypothetical protein|nr:hypothetical protein [Candidatus Micrarchaeota archaeon]